jgi:hypothetical protein
MSSRYTDSVMNVIKLYQVAVKVYNVTEVPEFTKYFRDMADAQCYKATLEDRIWTSPVTYHITTVFAIDDVTGTFLLQSKSITVVENNSL